MTKLIIGGRDFEVAPYKIKQLRLAAPSIDAINARAGADTPITTLTEMTAMLVDFIGALIVGIQIADPTITVDWLEENIGLGDMAALQRSFKDVMAASGMAAASGEAAAPPVPVADGA
ncbi:hypothetical protein D3Y57_09790 [Sphingomonas paeninsulae]|uniref:Uncharacterized protein n=1 Tax=Sphingomonas paeninsulae TaxID=2319844 RepID=A0A494TG01_SPHPE|nr:hypothetical protein [Sphingomonas paeninsulae]AYJ86202.1 hypothetical protein D3Y57_09790 [Sphingomonas paeninsulae]